MFAASREMPCFVMKWTNIASVAALSLYGSALGLLCVHVDIQGSITFILTPYFLSCVFSELRNVTKCAKKACFAALSL